MVLLCSALVFSTISYGVAEWYIQKHRKEPLSYGATFIADYARSLDLDAKETLNAIISDLNIKQLRLVSYWKNIEAVEGKYDFSDLDWQFDIANKAGIKVSLSIGVRQPRWPECHEPNWLDTNNNDWYAKLNSFITAVVDHYKNNPVLSSYQLENEFFMQSFGDCTDYNKQRLIDEFNMVKKLDGARPIIVTRSNNWIGIPVGSPRADLVGISVYKRIWDKTITKRYYEYPLPPWFYAALAGYTELFTDRNMYIHELQAEPWLPEGYSLKSASIDEMYKSMNTTILKKRLSYAKDTGMKQIDLWGVEWWYYMKEKRNAPEMWDTAKVQLQ